MVTSAYVHIPFCEHICYYCDFCRIVHKNHSQWLETILNEIKEKNCPALKTLYFGGGTPSCLNIEEFKQLSSLFSFEKDYEWTVECNPDSLSEDKIQLFKELGVNRISLGVQTFDEDLLKKIGRKHTNQQVNRSIHLLKENNITNISIDLIFGLPNQSLEDVLNDVDTFLTYDLPHLSIYSLQIEENSVFGKQNLKPIDEDLEADMYEAICEKLKNNGYVHYEISSFCKIGKESKHNLVYWSDQDFIGLGLGASGKEKNVRYDNTRNLKQYVENGATPNFIDTTNEEKAFEAIMLGLRTIYGLDIQKWQERYQLDFHKYDEIIEKYNPEFLIIEDKRLKPTQKGMEILNTILVEFLELE